MKTIPKTKIKGIKTNDTDIVAASFLTIASRYPYLKKEDLIRIYNMEKLLDQLTEINQPTKKPTDGNSENPLP